MAQVKIIRDGVFAEGKKQVNGATVEVSEAEAKAMVKNKLAEEIKKTPAAKAKKAK